MLRTHYEILQVPRNASPVAIKSAYRRLVQKWHPDKNRSNQAEAERILKLINRAYEVLSDPVRRKEYDEYIARNEEDEAKSAQSTSHSSAPKQHGSDQSASRGRVNESTDAKAGDERNLRKSTRFVGLVSLFSFAIVSVALLVSRTERVPPQSETTSPGLLSRDEIIGEFKRSFPIVLGGYTGDPRYIPSEVWELLFLRHLYESGKTQVESSLAENVFDDELLHRRATVRFLDLNHDGLDEVIVFARGNLANANFILLGNSQQGYKVLGEIFGHSIYVRPSRGGSRLYVVRYTQMGDEPDVIYVYDVRASDMVHRGTAELLGYHLVGPVGFGSVGEALGWKTSPVEPADVDP